MSPLTTIVLLSLTSITAYVISLTSLIHLLPQFIATLSVLFIIFNRRGLPVIFLVSFIVSLIVFGTNGIHSPFYFLIYFLIFVIALKEHPSISLSYSLVLILILCQSLNSLTSLIPILALILITPLVWFVGRQSQTIIRDETDFLLWLNLKFKTGITTIIDSTSQLQSTPLSYTQKEHLKKIKSSAKSLLNSSEKLTTEISSTPDEI